MLCKRKKYQRMRQQNQAPVDLSWIRFLFASAFCSNCVRVGVKIMALISLLRRYQGVISALSRQAETLLFFPSSFSLQMRAVPFQRHQAARPCRSWFRQEACIRLYQGLNKAWTRLEQSLEKASLKPRLKKKTETHKMNWKSSTRLQSQVMSIST